MRARREGYAVIVTNTNMNSDELNQPSIGRIRVSSIKSLNLWIVIIWLENLSMKIAINEKRLVFFVVELRPTINIERVLSYSKRQ